MKKLLATTAVLVALAYLAPAWAGAASVCYYGSKPSSTPCLVGVLRFDVGNHTDRMVRVEFYKPDSDVMVWWDIPSGDHRGVNSGNEPTDFNIEKVCVRAHYRNLPTDTVKVRISISDISEPGMRSHWMPGEACLTAAQVHYGANQIGVSIEP